MAALIFLSHIHEETVLAQTIQKAIEDEFSGFVEVFVSSDGKTIPAGANFLKRIEDGLTNCVGAIYLISPISVKRNWINFELGAVWIRNSVSVKNGGPEIPTIPVCHSGITPGTLPMPLINLSAIQADSSSQLELVLKSIQTAVGGKGALKTDFDALAQNIIAFEKQYTLGDNLVKLFTSISVNNAQINQVIAQCKTMAKGTILKIPLGMRDNSLIRDLKSLEKTELNGHLTVNQTSSGMGFGTGGAVTGGDVEISISRDLMVDFEQLLNQKIK
ncbi:MAG: toll/interleukin-1 receptor domain-containing protein [Bacteroidetes bacterium]|nr:toll/interleukin-1 receptor domain-containing protein [Bacteroidota bacterium]